MTNKDARELARVIYVGTQRIEQYVEPLKWTRQSLLEEFMFRPEDITEERLHETRLTMIDYIDQLDDVLYDLRLTLVGDDEREGAEEEIDDWQGK